MYYNSVEDAIKVDITHRSTMHCSKYYCTVMMLINQILLQSPGLGDRVHGPSAKPQQLLHLVQTDTLQELKTNTSSYLSISQKA